MCTTKMDSKYHQITLYSGKRMTVNLRISQLAFAVIFIMRLGMPSFVFGQFPISAGTSGTSDYTIPSGFNSINVTVKGAVGGSSTSGGCTANGGKGAVFNARFFIDNTFCPAISLESGGTLRVIVGTNGPFVSTDFGAGGGGGSALLYRKPGTDNWITLVIAGGGGGGVSVSFPCRTNNGGDAQLGPNGGNGNNNGGRGGTGGNGGFSYLLDGFGGGGANSDGNSIGGNCNGQSGYPSGGAGGDCGTATTNAGGFGYGGGGAASYTNGGGGGGYSGGGGGGPLGGGGGGGSYLSPWATLITSTVENVNPGHINVTGENLGQEFLKKRLYVNKNVIAGTQDGSSWANAFSNLQDALKLVEATSFCSADIWVAAGTYYPDEGVGYVNDGRGQSFKMKSGVKLYGGFAGDETDISQRNWFNNKSYLSGDLLQNNADYNNAQFSNYVDNAYHVIRSENTDNTSLLDGFYIQSGNADGTGEDASGAGIYMNNSTMTVANCQISFNSAEQGSGLYLLASSPVILNSYIKSNKAITGAAGVYNNFYSSGYFYNCVFHSNQVGTTTPAGGGGGAILNYNNSSPDFVNCTISGNDAKTGGAVYNLDNAHPNFYNAIIWNNRSVLTAPISTDGSSSMAYFHCLLQGVDLSGANENLDGSDINNSPFEIDADLDQTPVATGNLQLKTCSQAIDRGGEYFDQSVDVLDNPRIVNDLIDLGAFEKQYNLQSITFYYDKDRDGYGDPNNSIQSCTRPEFYVTNSEDCNDNDNTIHPGAIEIFDGVDNNCNGVADENTCPEVSRLYVKWNATGSATGSSWENAIPKLQDALLRAACNNVVEIWVAQGTYYPDEGIKTTNNNRAASFAMREGLAIYGGFRGDETQLNQRNLVSNQYETILSGDIDQNDGPDFTNNNGNSYHVVHNKENNLTNTAILDGFTISGGNANLDDALNSQYGGGILNAKSSPSIINCKFFNNSALGLGGAILNVEAPTVNIVNCVFAGNKASEGQGGAVCNVLSSVSITSSNFDLNQSLLGGAIYNNTVASFAISNCRFSQNKATQGAAIFNTSSVGSITGSNFLTNEADNAGGAIYNYSGSSLDMLKSSFSGNKAQAGGAITNDASKMSLINSVLLDNISTVSGGAIINASTGEINLSNCSFMNNSTAPFGGSSIANIGHSNITATNCILWGSEKFQVLQDQTAPVTITYSDVKYLSLYPGSGNIFLDPLFVDASNGDLHLAPSSPAINTGINSANNELTDFDGNPRVSGVKIDMGAYELQEQTCSPIRLTSGILTPQTISGCGTDAIGAVTFAYSTSALNLTPVQYNSINFAIAAGSCDLSTVTYVDAIDEQLSSPGNLVVNRTFALTDASHNTASANQVITVADNIKPTVLAKNITIQLDASGHASITDNAVDNGSSDNCTAAASLLFSTDIKSFTCSNVGQPVTVTLTVTDANGNSDSKTATVTVQDHVKPIVLTKNITVQLDATGHASITDNAVDNGSSDNCTAAASLLFSTDIKSFTCSNVGQPVTVTLTVTDANGNSDSKTATVTVQDHVKPIVLTKNNTVQLDGSGSASITPSQINNGSTDNCTPAANLVLALDKTTFNCSNVGNPATVTLTVTDASGNSYSKTATVTVQDNIKPTTLCKAISVYLGTNGTVTIAPQDVDNGTSDNCSFTLALSKTMFTTSDFGNNTVTLTATDPSGNYSSCQATVTVLRRPTVLVYKGDGSEQYSDKQILTAVLTDQLTNMVLSSKTVVFAIGAQSASATTGANGIASTDLVLTQDPAPVYTVTTTFAGDGIYAASTDSDPFDITQEDARATYTGALSVSTSGTTSSAATVTLSATIQEITAVPADPAYDAFKGDITKATVRFVNRDAGNAVIATVPIGLVNVTDKTVGTVTYNWKVDIGNADAVQYNIGIIVDGYYTRNSSAEDEVVNVAKPLNDFITGGGYLILDQPAGQILPKKGSRNNFGFNVKYNKSGTNLQGSINTIVRSDEGKVYQVKGNAMTSLSIMGATSTKPAQGIFNGKATIQDITDPLNAIPVDGNASLQVTMTDLSSDGKYDRVAITVWNKSGGLWFASNWNGVKTLEQTIARGDLKVNSSSTNVTGTLLTINNLASSPNPSLVGQAVTFAMAVTGSGTSKPSGSVTFVDYSTNATLGTVSLNSSTGTATITISALTLGLHQVVAYYSGDSKYSSGSAQTIQSVSNTVPTITVSSRAENPVPKFFRAQAFPNPTYSYFKIAVESSDKKAQLSYRVFDALGRLIEVKQAFDFGSAIKIGHNYRPGVYTIDVSQGNEARQLKLVKIPD
jgi:hypothetical protein